jgi:hypothetical protein
MLMEMEDGQTFNFLTGAGFGLPTSAVALVKMLPIAKRIRLAWRMATLADDKDIVKSFIAKDL